MVVKKKGLWGDRSGNVGLVWLTVLAGIFTIFTTYLITYPLVCVRLYNIALEYAPPGTEGGYFSILLLIRVVFNIWPWIMSIGLLIWAYIAMQRREYEHGW